MSYFTKRLDERVVEILKYGGVGFLPSDTIYGLSCQALNQSAIEKIYRLKRRDSDKPFIVLIANNSQLEQLGINQQQTEAASSYWPGPLTLICETTAPDWLHRGTRTLAVRMPDNEDLRNIIAKTAPLVSTSANAQGGEPINSVKEAQEYFENQLDFYVDVGDLSNHLPSTLVRSNNGKLEVIRQGVVEIKGDNHDV